MFAGNRAGTRTRMSTGAGTGFGTRARAGTSTDVGAGRKTSSGTGILAKQNINASGQC